MGGTPVFCGTRVPVQTLLDYLKAGDSIITSSYDSFKDVDVLTFSQPLSRR